MQGKKTEKKAKKACQLANRAFQQNSPNSIFKSYK